MMNVFQISSDSEINDFMIELSGFLKEMLCPFQSFISGPVSQRFLFVESRLIILDYLLTELMAMKMCHKLKPKENVVIEVVSIECCIDGYGVLKFLN